MADTAALVVALSAQLTKFEKDMQRAGIMAERAVGDIEGKFAKMNPQVNASFLGNLFSNAVSQGIQAATKALTEFYDRFIMVGKEAAILGMSLRDIWAFQEAAKEGGASIDNAARGMRTLANLLSEMQRGDTNSLSRLLDANSASEAMQGINRETMTLAQTMQVVATLIQDTGKGVDKIEVGRLAGLSEDMALSLGKAGVSLTSMQAAAAATAPPLEKMVEEAKKFDSYMQSAWNWVKADLGRGITNTIREVEQIKGALGVGTDTPASFADRFGALPPQAGASATGVTGKNTTVIPLKDKAAGGAAKQSDEFQRANDQITKNIALLDAQTKTMFMNVGAQAAARAEAQLMEGERRRLNIAEGEAVPISEELRKKIDAQAAAMSRATLENAKAAQHLQRINEAYDTFGSAVSTAFADAIIEGKKLNEVLSSLLKTLARAAINSTITGLFNSFKPGAFAGGTDYAPGGMALVGERGPELVNLPRGSQVIPNDVLRGGMSGGGSITYAPAIDARGASVEAVARLAQIIEQDRAMFASRTVATIQQARRGRVPGV
jgi:hypothetical protein